MVVSWAFKAGAVGHVDSAVFVGESDLTSIVA